MPYITPSEERERIKKAVLCRIARSQRFRPSGKGKYRCGEVTVHPRFCSTRITTPDKYQFNINPNSLSADFELWICGSELTYYLVPHALIKSMYGHPAAYVDSHHAAIHIVGVNTQDHTVVYGAGSLSFDLRSYLLGTL